MAQINVLLDSLQKVKKTGADRWVACCPAHADKSPSLSVRYIDDKILLKCFGGCAVDEVVSAIGLTLSDLMPEKLGNHKPTKTRIPASDILQFIGFEAQIVSLAADTIINGKILSDADLKRLVIAQQRLDGAARECLR